MPHFIRLIARACGCALVLAATAASGATPAQVRNNCAPAGEWAVPGGGRVAAQDILSRAARESVVLLGESHDNADHHRWQLATIAGLAALHPRLVLGFEMFPRAVQPILDRWVGGELGEAAFLQATDWPRVWGHESSLYVPLFHFARLNRIPMVALNVERDFVRTVGAKGLDAVPVEKREGVTEAAPASEPYLERLFEVYAAHPEKRGTPSRSDPEFRRFVDAQLVWDSAMAQALAKAAASNPGALVIGIMGSGHISDGYGVPHQLLSLGVSRVASLLPWGANANCEKLVPGLATAVFGVPAELPAPPRLLLGITVETVPGGVKVSGVRTGSIAASAGLQAGDVLVEVAGAAVKVAGDVRAIVQSMVPGTWLPLRATRDGRLVEFTAKFPTAGK